MRERNWDLKNLAVQSASQRSVRLRAPKLICDLSVLGPDLFRIRVARGTRFAADLSWSVVARPGDGEGNLQQEEKSIHLATAQGGLRCNLQTGEITLADLFGFEVFRFPAGGMRFQPKTAQVSFPLAEHEKILGLGETTGTWDKRGQVRELWNIDVLGHSSAIHPDLKSLYISVPFIISLRDGRAAGLFWDNPARQVWEVGQPDDDICRVTADSGEINLYLFLGPRLPGILQAYTALTGRMKMPPAWALGYHQSRYSYESAAALKKIAAEFRARNIPCDGLYLDIDSMDGYRVFTFGKSFPKAQQMVASLHKMGFKVLPIVDPGVKVDAKFGVFARGAKQKFYVRDRTEKKDFQGKVWPGLARFPDFLNHQASAWWSREQCAFQKRFALDGFWNDMNEPANFAAANKTLDPRALHRTDFGPKRHAEVHNVYGLQMARASEEGALFCEPNRRPFIISRAGCAGIQRHALVWTGDNSATWEHLADSIQMLLNLSLSGIPFCGSDVGGFLEHSTGELLARWTQLAAFTPFFRNHSNKGTRPQEPWQFGGKVDAICRKYIELRYQLFPYIYALFAEAARSGAPIMRPLIWHFQNDATAAAVRDQFMLGPSMLIAPITQQGGTARSVYLPSGRWHSFWTGQEYPGGQHALVVCDLETIPLFIRAGSLIPFQALQQFLGGKPSDTITLHIWPGRSGTLDWYEDDGASNEYLAGAFLRRKLAYVERKKGGSLQFSPSEGTYPSAIKTWRIVVHTPVKISSVKTLGQELPAQYIPELGLFIFDVPNSSEPFKLTWR